jgi:hypothetical protein
LYKNALALHCELLKLLCSDSYGILKVKLLSYWFKHMLKNQTEPSTRFKCTETGGQHSNTDFLSSSAAAWRVYPIAFPDSWDFPSNIHRRITEGTKAFHSINQRPNQHTCVISGFRREGDENCALPGCYRCSLRNNPEECSSLISSYQSSWSQKWYALWQNAEWHTVRIKTEERKNFPWPHREGANGQ